MAPTRQGPLLRIEGSCIGCDNLIPGGERPPQCLALSGRMMPTTSPVPAWCPELPAARLALARGIVAEAEPLALPLPGEAAVNPKPATWDDGGRR